MVTRYPRSNAGNGLNEKLDRWGREEVWEQCFSRRTLQQAAVPVRDGNGGAESYFNHLYHQECLRLQKGLKHETRLEERLSAKSHRDVADIAAGIRAGRGKAKGDLIQGLQSQPRYAKFTKQHISESLNLTVRLAFLVHAQDVQTVASSPWDTSRFIWDDKQSFCEYVGAEFPKSTWSPQGKESLTRMNQTFTIPFMASVCDLKLEYTSSLQDHLRLLRINGRYTLRVFPYKTCLAALLQDGE